MAVDVEVLRRRLSHLNVALDERSRRLALAAEARALGFGGVERVHRATGMARSTVARGIRELEGAAPADAWRVRRYGGGRKGLVEQDPTLLPDLMMLFSPGITQGVVARRGESPRSVRSLARGLALRGHRISYPVVAKLLREAGLNRPRQPRGRLPRRRPRAVRIDPLD
jgi:hypothetical protein